MCLKLNARSSNSNTVSSDRRGRSCPDDGVEDRKRRDFLCLRTQDWVRQKSPNHPSSLRESGLKA
jgi:hypothetical protein